MLQLLASDIRTDGMDEPTRNPSTKVRCLDLDEAKPLLADKAIGKIPYDDFKK